MLRDFVNLFFPKYCLACSQAIVKGEKYLCTECILSLPKTNIHLSDENNLLLKFHNVIEVKHVFAYLKYFKKGITQRLLYKLKYDNQPQIGEALARWYAYDLIRAYPERLFDIIIPVPLHKSKLRIRGYNQSDGIAKGLSEVLQVPWSGNALKRAIKSKSQVKKSGRLERWENVKDIFTVTDTSLIKGKRILLVDDVLTTGATLEACSIPLVNEGCLEISFLTLAVTQ